MVPWFIVKQTRMETVMTISRADSPTVLLENGSMVHNQMSADIETETIGDLSRECLHGHKGKHDRTMLKAKV